MPHAHFEKATILIIDDEPANVRLLERFLEKFKVRAVHSTTDARQALPLFLEVEPDLVLLDLHMPHLNGFEVMAQLKSAVPAGNYLPLLVLTADVTIETRRRALAAGARDFVTKPLDHTDVILRMVNLLENRFLHLDMQKQNLWLEKQVRERTSQVEAAMQQLRTAQEQVVKQERLRALGMMAGGIAHDFNNALTLVLGYGELLLPWIAQQDSPRELGYIHHMVAAAQDAAHVVSRLREFYRPAENNEIRVTLDVNAIVEQAISLTSPKWKGKSLADGVQIRVTSALGEVEPVAGNAAELREVLTNLIFNAVDAMPRGGAITVSTSTSEERVMISVADTGCGMTDAERARCLEPFFTTKGDNGTGLGLAVVYGIVQRHGGTIEIASEKGYGATFTIALPVSEPTDGVVAVVDEPVGNTLRILVVDDQAIICELVAEYLKSDGHMAAVAESGQEALALFATTDFDLVITDQSMPDMNGVQLAAEIKQRMPQTPVILLTGFGDEMQSLAELPEGVDLVVGKPVSTADLRRAIFQVVPGKAMEVLALSLPG